MNKRFLVFAGYGFYPSGGWGDFIGAYTTYDEALKGAQEAKVGGLDWAEVVDLAEKKVIDERTCSCE